MKGGETSRSVASISCPASAFNAGSTATMRPSCTPMSTPTRPSGRLAPRTIKSIAMSSLPFLLPASRTHETSGPGPESQARMPVSDTGFQYTPVWVRMTGTSALD